MVKKSAKRILFVVNIDHFFLSHRLPIAMAAQKIGFEVHIATAITSKLDVLKAYGFKVHSLSLTRGNIGFLNAFKTILRLHLIMKEVKPDLVHLVTIKPIILGGLVARWMKVPALVTAVSGLGYVFTANGLIARVRRWLVNFLYTSALAHDNQVVIFQNSDDRDTLMAATGLLPAKVEMIKGSGVDLKQFVLTALPEGVPVVLLPARLLKDKGVLEFVTAANLLRAKRIAARFVLVGQIDAGNPTSISKEKLDSWVANGTVESWGDCLNMPQVLSSATIIVLPSYREGLPKALQEAAACGRVVVTTDVPGCRDAIEPGISGLLVPARSVGCLAEAIQQLLIDPNKCKTMGLAGRQLAEQYFDSRAVVEKHLAIYKKLLN